MVNRYPTTLSAWYWRLLLAALFAFGAEILLWNNPLQRNPTDWLLLIPGYSALAALALDLAARYRIRDVYDAMTLLAIIGLLAGLLLNPQTGLAEVPDTLVNRVLGGQALLALEMFGLLLALTGGHIQRYRRNLLLASIWLGSYWGIWVRWLPQFTDLTPMHTSIETLLLVGALGLVPVLLLYGLAVRRGQNVTPPDLRLSVVEWGAVLVTLVLLLMIRVLQGENIGAALPWVAVLIVLCYGILWFRRQDTGKTLLDNHLPPTPLSWVYLVLALGIFVVTTVIAYHLPLVNLFGLNQFSLMTLGFAGVGLGWLPLIAMVLGVQALDRQSRTGRL